jgi:hypothetical protein
VLAVIVAAVLLALSITASTVPGLRQRVFGPLPGVTATATRTPGDDLFYLLPNPPGVDVMLDGRTLTRLPFPGDPHPLRLAPGRHVFAWRSRILPFRPLRCQVSVPPAPGDSCSIVIHEFIPSDLADEPGSIIAVHDSLAALDPADASRLSAAIRFAFDDSASTATVQPGERYFSRQQGAPGGLAVATEPLHVTLTYRFQQSTGYPEPCILGQPAIPCRFPGQDCGQLCTVPQLPASLAGPPGTWIVAVMVNDTYGYTTLGGQVVDEEPESSLGIQLAALRVTRDAGGWHVAPILGYTPGLPVADDPVCDPARFQLGQNPVWAFIVDGPPPGASVAYASDANPADGCVAVVQGFGQPAPVFLERFGVLLTVNDAAASNSYAGLPAADAAERALAQRLLAPLAGT